MQQFPLSEHAGRVATAAPERGRSGAENSVAGPGGFQDVFDRPRPTPAKQEATGSSAPETGAARVSSHRPEAAPGNTTVMGAMSSTLSQSDFASRPDAADTGTDLTAGARAHSAKAQCCDAVADWPSKPEFIPSDEMPVERTIPTVHRVAWDMPDPSACNGQSRGDVDLEMPHISREVGAGDFSAITRGPDSAQAGEAQDDMRARNAPVSEDFVDTTATSPAAGPLVLPSGATEPEQHDFAQPSGPVSSVGSDGSRYPGAGATGPSEGSVAPATQTEHGARRDRFPVTETPQLSAGAGAAGARISGKATETVLVADPYVPSESRSPLGATEAIAAERQIGRGVADGPALPGKGTTAAETRVATVSVTGAPGSATAQIPVNDTPDLASARTPAPPVADPLPAGTVADPVRAPLGREIAVPAAARPEAPAGFAATADPRQNMAAAGADMPSVHAQAATETTAPGSSTAPSGGQANPGPPASTLAGGATSPAVAPVLEGGSTSPPSEDRRAARSGPVRGAEVQNAPATLTRSVGQAATGTLLQADVAALGPSDDIVRAGTFPADPQDAALSTGVTDAPRSEAPRQGPFAPPLAEAPRPAMRAMAETLNRAPDGMVEVTLSPEELGRVRLTLHPGDSGITVSIAAERPETLDLMRRHADLLGSAMRELGYDDVSLDFGAGQPGGGGMPGSDDGTLAPTEAEISGPVTETTPAPRGLRANSALDLRM